MAWVEQVDELRLSDGVVVLRPSRRDDAAAVFEACQDAELVRHTSLPQRYTWTRARRRGERRFEREGEVLWNTR
jgi:hypothetical protein